MKIDKSELVKKINVLEKVIPTKPSIACMEGILVHDGRMCANDLQNAISIATPEAENECFIIPRKAIAMAKSLPDGLVQITPQTDNSIVIKAGTIRTKMNSFPRMLSLIITCWRMQRKPQWISTIYATCCQA